MCYYTNKKIKSSFPLMIQQRMTKIETIKNVSGEIENFRTTSRTTII